MSLGNCCSFIIVLTDLSCNGPLSCCRTVFPTFLNSRTIINFSYHASINIIIHVLYTFSTCRLCVPPNLILIQVEITGLVVWDEESVASETFAPYMNHDRILAIYMTPLLPGSLYYLTFVGLWSPPLNILHNIYFNKTMLTLRLPRRSSVALLIINVTKQWGACPLSTSHNDKL